MGILGVGQMNLLRCSELNSRILVAGKTSETQAVGIDSDREGGIRLNLNGVTDSVSFKVIFVLVLGEKMGQVN